VCLVRNTPVYLLPRLSLHRAHHAPAHTLIDTTTSPCATLVVIIVTILSFFSSEPCTVFYTRVWMSLVPGINRRLFGFTTSCFVYPVVETKCITLLAEVLLVGDDDNGISARPRCLCTCTENPVLFTACQFHSNHFPHSEPGLRKVIFYSLAHHYGSISRSFHSTIAATGTRVPTTSCFIRKRLHRGLQGSPLQTTRG
jgi:hypothetical protein